MAIYSEAIDTYLVYHLNTDNTYDQSGVINCYLGNSYKGSLYFYRDGASIPASSRSGSGYLYLRFNANQMMEILETLRQETPLTIWFNDVNLWGGLTTSKEPIGEEES